MKNKNNFSIALMSETAMFTAIITLVTAFVMHIPLGNGYVHLGDVFIYIAGCVLPLPYAIFAASVGAALADGLVGATIWVLPTLIIKTLMVLAFSNEGDKLLTKRNIIACIIGGLICCVGYGIAQAIMYGDWLMFFFPNPWIQSAASVPLFLIIAKAMDKAKIKTKLFNMDLRKA